MAANGRVDPVYLPETQRAERAGTVPPRRGRSRRRVPGFVWLPVSLLAGVLGWALVVRVSGLPPYILPPPERVLARFGTALADGTWWRHTRITLLESVLGFGMGFSVAVVLGYLLARIRGLERALSPYLAASQALPVVAIAPLLVLWLGYGLASKVVVCALVVFFPILVNTLVGIRNVPRDLLEVAQVYGASRWQTLWLVELPLALPVLLGGVRLGLTLSITGAVVGEFVGSDVGLGALVNISQGAYDTALTFVALTTLIAVASLYYGLAAALDRLFLDWQER